MEPPGPLHQIGPARQLGGGVTARVVRAGWFRPDAGGFFGVVPRPLWAPLVETDDRGRLLCRLNLVIVDAGGSRLLLETGTGARIGDRQRAIKGVEGGDPAEALRAVGEDPDSFDLVVVSHLHYDHAGGMLDAEGRPAFPNARYVVQRDEATAARGDELRLKGVMEVEQLEAVREAGQLYEVDGDVELVSGVRVLRTGGHTRGSQATLLGVEGAGDRAILWGDLIPTRWQLPVRWTSAYDDYPIEAVEIRNQLVARAADEAWWCYFTHDPGETPLRIERTEKGSFRARDPHRSSR